MMTEAVKKITPDEDWDAQLPKPCGYRLLIALPDISDYYEGSTLLKTDSEKHKEYIMSIMGVVIDIGDAAYTDKDRFPTGPWCKVGDYVMFRMNTGTRFKVNGKEFRLMNDDSIEAVIPDPRGICKVQEQMMAFQKVEYEFPDEKDKKPEIEVEGSDAVEIDLSGKAAKEPDPEPARTNDANNDKLEIEVVDDTPQADRNRKASEPPADVTDEELEEYSDKVRNRIKHFSKGYHDERREKEKAIRERQELESLAQRLVNENKELKGTVGKNQSAMLDQAKRSAEAELASAKAAYKEAYESGEAEAVVEAQEKLTAAKIKSDKVNNFKLPALQEEETPVNVLPEPAQPVADPKAKDWAAANPWFGSDDEMTSFAMGVHNKLAKDNVVVGSDDYYEKLNTRMRQVFPDNFEDTTEEIEVERPKQANVVAPATRSVAPKKVKLTQTQVAIAKRLGVPLELYAQKVAEEMRKDNG